MGYSLIHLSHDHSLVCYTVCSLMSLRRFLDHCLFERDDDAMAKFVIVVLSLNTTIKKKPSWLYLSTKFLTVDYLVNYRCHNVAKQGRTVEATATFRNRCLMKNSVILHNCSFNEIPGVFMWGRTTKITC